MEKVYKLAIVGTRTFDDWELFCEKVDATCKQLENEGFTSIEIVSGGARGADALAEKYANLHGFSKRVFLPDWNRYGREAGPRRNRLIVQNCDGLIAFWDGHSPGTLCSINLAESAEKLLDVFKYNTI